MQSLQLRNTVADSDPANPSIDISLEEAWSILVRRRAIIIQSIIIITVLGTIITLLTKPVYQAKSRLLVDGQSFSINTVDDSNPLSGILALSQEQDVATQVEELQAKPLLDEVNHDTGGAALTVEQVKDTDVIEVTAEANKPTTAANAANVLLETYIKEDVDRSLNEIRNAENFASKQEVLAHQKLVNSENEIRAFKQSNHVEDLQQNQTQQLGYVSGLTQKVQTDQSSINALRSELAAYEQLLRVEPKAISVNLPQSNPMRATIEGQLATLRLQRISITQRGGFTSNAPEVVAIDAQIAELNKQLSSEPAVTNLLSSNQNPGLTTVLGTIDNVKGQIASSEASLSSDQRALNDAQAGAGKYPDWAVTLDDLNREHDTAQAEDQMFSEKIAELSLREQAHHVSANIIQYAEVPNLPVRPRRVTNIVLSALFGVFVGVLLALIQDKLDDRINSADEASLLLGASALGMIPTFEEGQPRLLFEMKGLAPEAESYRVLRTNIHFAAVDSPVRSLLVTSSGPSEGKTTTATNIAFAMALDGKKVILVDTDLRRPSLHKILKLPVAPGLTDVLLGHAPLEDVLQPHEQFANLSILCSGSTPPNPSELLNSRKFRALMEELKEQADIVIFDSAPVLVAADSAILASEVDGTLFVIETGQTKKAASKRAMQTLNHARAAILGIACNKMSLREGEGYYYYRYNYHTMLPEGQNGSRNGRSSPSVLKLGGKDDHASVLDSEDEKN